VGAFALAVVVVNEAVWLRDGRGKLTSMDDLEAEATIQYRSARP
jgi:hypothetical protein